MDLKDIGYLYREKNKKLKEVILSELILLDISVLKQCENSVWFVPWDVSAALHSIEPKLRLRITGSIKWNPANSMVVVQYEIKLPEYWKGRYDGTEYSRVLWWFANKYCLKKDDQRGISAKYLYPADQEDILLLEVCGKMKQNLRAQLRKMLLTTQDLMERNYKTILEILYGLYSEDLRRSVEHEISLFQAELDSAWISELRTGQEGEYG